MFRTKDQIRPLTQRRMSPGYIRDRYEISDKEETSQTTDSIINQRVPHVGIRFKRVGKPGWLRPGGDSEPITLGPIS